MNGGGDRDAEGLIRLASALEFLRSELEAAWQEGKDKQVQFLVSEMTVTLQAVARREREGVGKVRWYVLEAGGSAKSGGETTQTVALTLTPGSYDEHGQFKSLKVTGHQQKPGG